jgi:hypothetical protein
LPKEFKKSPGEVSSEDHFETDLIVRCGHDVSNLCQKKPPKGPDSMRHQSLNDT